MKTFFGCFILLGTLLAAVRPASAQQKTPVTSVQPDCMVFFNLSVASSGAQAAVNATGTSTVIDNHQPGCYGWTVAVTNHGFSAESLSFQSAPDNAAGTAPGTWATVAVCGGTECLGINPNTTTTSAITTTKVIAPWLRVNLTSKTGTGAVVGVLYGWKVNVVANGGGPVPPPPSPVTPGLPFNSVQYNNAGAFGAIPNSLVHPTGSAAGMVEVGPFFGTPNVGLGTIQNFLIWSECWDCGVWDTTNITISNTQLAAPNGATVGDNDLTSTANGAFLSQFFDTGTAMTGRSFSFSVWVKVPTTPVTARFVILSNTPTTAASSTFSVTTSWQRFSLTGTFGVDAGTQVGVDLVPVDGGQGLIYAWGAQLEEASFDGPYCPTDNINYVQRTLGICGPTNTSAVGPGTPPYYTALDFLGDIFNFGRRNNTNNADRMWMFGEELNVTATPALISGFGDIFHTGNPLTNDIAYSTCLGSDVQGQASTGSCTQLILPSNDGTAPGPAMLGRVSFVQLSLYNTAYFTVTLGVPDSSQSLYCSDCTVTSGIDNTCAAAGSGAFAARINGAWKCTI